MRRSRFPAIDIPSLSAGCLIFACLFTGCSTNDPALTDQLSVAGKQFLLPTEPEDAVGILEYRDGASDQTAKAGNAVTLIGKIGGGAVTWSPGEAAFVMSDPVANIGDDHVCSDGCAFCKKKKEERPNPTAIVQFQGGDGKVLPIDARKLLSVEESQTVVVRGTAVVDSIGNLVVSANGIYVRR